jgi:hypothetical protein
VLLFALAAVAIVATTPAYACTPPMAPVQDRETGAYFASVTSVYRAVAEDFRPTDPRFPGDNFTVRLRPIETIWGDAPPAPVNLRFTAGACISWDIWGDRSEDEPVDGQRFLVFFAPAAAGDVNALRVVPDDYASGERTLSLWRIVRAGREGVSQRAVQETPSAFASLMRVPIWFWIATASFITLILGFLLGRSRALGATQNKQHAPQ